jgi:hypothetical protein
VGDFISSPLDYDLIQNFPLGVVSSPNTSFPAELHSGSFAPVGRWKKQLTPKEVGQLESLIGDELRESGYPLCSAIQPKASLRLRTLRVVYPTFYCLKEWLRLKTPLGRFVNLKRLQLQN